MRRHGPSLRNGLTIGEHHIRRRQSSAKAHEHTVPPVTCDPPWIRCTRQVQLAPERDVKMARQSLRIEYRARALAPQRGVDMWTPSCEPFSWNNRPSGRRSSMRPNGRSSAARSSFVVLTVSIEDGQRVVAEATAAAVEIAVATVARSRGALEAMVLE